MAKKINKPKEAQANETQEASADEFDTDDMPMSEKNLSNPYDASGVGTSVEDSPEKEEAANLTPSSDVPSFTVEKQVEDGTTPAIVYPKILAGRCEFCGQDYSECKHYKGVPIKCSYCPAEVDTTAFRQRTLFVYALPETPNRLICVCDDYNCTKKHQERFSRKVYT